MTTNVPAGAGLDHARLFAGFRPIFGDELSQKQVDCLNHILAAWWRFGDGNPRHLAYILATAKHETRNFDFVREIWGPTAAQKGYEGRADLGNTVKGDGKRFMGRGFVQITGRRNYFDWSKRLGIDLLSKPSLAEGYEVAARIMVEGMMKGTFTGKKLADYPSDFVESRRIVNGMDRATLIAGYAYRFLDAIGNAAMPAETVSAPQPPPIPAEPQTPTPEPRNTRGIIGIVLAALVGAAGLAIGIWNGLLAIIDKVF